MNPPALHHVQSWSVLQCFRQVTRPDAFAPRQVGDRARQLEHTMIAARRELQLVHGGLHQVLDGFIQGAELAHFRWAHIRVARNRYRRSRRSMLRLYGKTGALAVAGGFYTGTDGGGGLSQAAL